MSPRLAKVLLTLTLELGPSQLELCDMFQTGRGVIMGNTFLIGPIQSRAIIPRKEVIA